MLSTSFRNTLIASTLLVGASILVSPAAMAADDNGLVGGHVDEINTVDFNNTNTPTATNLTATDHPMGTLTIANNDPEGWILQVHSLTGGQLRHTTHVNSTNPVFIEYAHLDATDEPTGSTVGDLTAIPDTATAFITAPYSASFATTAGAAITITADLEATGTVGTDDAVNFANLPSGEYSDTLYFTLISR